MARSLSAVTAILAIAVAGGRVPAVAAAPAAAAACSGSTGVTVIVDFNELGGGVTAGCDRDGAGQPASRVTTDAGYDLTFVQDDPGFVCRVSGVPADNPCVRTPPASAYWSLWWSDGESGRWSYSTSGVNALEVPDGGYVAFAWHQGDGRAAPPDATPTPHEEPVEPSDGPSGNGGDDGGGNGGSNGDGGGGGDRGDDAGPGPSTDGTPTTSAPTTSVAPTTRATDAASPDERRKRRDRETDEPSASASSTDAVPAADEITAGPPESDLGTEVSGDDGGALPTWIGLGLAVLVLGAAGLVTVLRRRTG